MEIKEYHYPFFEVTNIPPNVLLKMGYIWGTLEKYGYRHHHNCLVTVKSGVINVYFDEIPGVDCQQFLKGEEVSWSLRQLPPAITMTEFKSIPGGTVFRSGETVDSAWGANMATTLQRLKYVAKKGYNNDWCIYIHLASRSLEWIEHNGDKVHMAENIKKLIPCDDDVFKLYRY